LAVSSKAEPMARHFSGGPSPGRFSTGDHRTPQATALRLRTSDSKMSAVAVRFMSRNFLRPRRSFVQAALPVPSRGAVAVSGSDPYPLYRTAPTVARRLAHSPFQPVHRAVDGLGKHAARTVHGLWIAVCVEKWITRLGGHLRRSMASRHFDGLCARKTRARWLRWLGHQHDRDAGRCRDHVSGHRAVPAGHQPRFRAKPLLRSA
jgi:hypothetical protein